MSSIRIRYKTYVLGAHDIHTRTLRDTNQFDELYVDDSTVGISASMWPLFGVVWPSGQVLADLMSRHDLDGLRILEVGCGIGLASLVANRRGAQITATDLHPEAGAFLQRNTELNEDPDIPFQQVGWGGDEWPSGLGTFDLIIGSDLLYERTQIEHLATFIGQHASEVCTVILVDPGRGRMGRMAKAMEARGYTHGRIEVPSEMVESFGERVQVHSYKRNSSVDAQVH